MAHDEFPELTPQSRAALQAAEKSYEQGITNLGFFYRERKAKAAFLREALDQVSPGRDFLIGSIAYELNLIADNLHSLPPTPPPPTPEQMNDILQDLAEEFGNEIDPKWSLNPFETLERGIAHYCKVQP